MSRPSRPSTRRLSGAGAAALFFTLAVSTAPASGHDFWLEPSTFSPETPATVRVDIRVGEDFDGRPVRRNQAHIERFVIAGPGGEREVPGFDGREPAGLAGVTSAGAHQIAYESTGSTITLTADRFESYLGHEGLEQVIQARRDRGEEDADGREIFVRSAKSLLFAAGDHSGYDRRLGLPLELVPRLDPARLTSGEPLELILLFDGEPASGVLVRLRGRQRPTAPVSARTDDAGLVSLPIEGAGPWLATAVHMQRVEDFAGADWRSFWASLTFAGPSPAEPPAAAANDRAGAAEPRRR